MPKSGKLGGNSNELIDVSPGTKYNVEYVIYIIETDQLTPYVPARFFASAAPGLGPGTAPSSIPPAPDVHRPARVLWTTTLKANFEAPAGINRLELKFGP